MTRSSGFNLIRRSLLAQLLGVYLVFVAAIFAADYKVNAVAQQQVTSQVQTTDLALAQEIASETATKLSGAEKTLIRLSRLPDVRSGNTAAMRRDFNAFRAARPDVDLVYWLDASGILTLSSPLDYRTLGASFANSSIYTSAAHASGPVLQDGVNDFTTYSAAVELAVPVRGPGDVLRGILATNLMLDDLSQPIKTVVGSQAQQGQHVLISLLDAHGQLIASVEQERIMQNMVPELLGSADALAGRSATRQGSDAQGQEWLYSSVPVAVPIANARWAVVVQRSARDALAVITDFQRWITVAAVVFALGGLLFWIVLLRRVVRPLHALAHRHTTLPATRDLNRPPSTLTGRADEIGGLARSLDRLEGDVVTRLGEMHTLLETSSAVVTSLDPTHVGRTIIQEVRRLVDIQAAAVLVPDEEGVLRVLVSEGRSEAYDEAVQVPPDQLTLPSALALHEGRPVQMVAGEDEDFPARAYDTGFRALIAVPIISHVGNVVLVVHRCQTQRFSDHEVELLLTFANYAALAWEHAVLYERSDERLREVARENERLYRQAMAEKQTLAAIMQSMHDGLVLTSVEGKILYANPGASAITGLPVTTLEGGHIDDLDRALRATARDQESYDRLVADVRSRKRLSGLVEMETDAGERAITLHLFDVRDDSGQRAAGEAKPLIGRGLLLRDVTRERELDQFKTTLLAAVGHELRTPLAAIKGYASTLLQNDVSWSPDEEHHFLTMISAESDRLAQLVTNLLDLSRIEAGLLPLHREPARLDGLVERAARRLPVAPDKPQPADGITVAIPPDLPPLNVDAARMEVVLHNLMANALAYGNGRVHVSAEMRDAGLLIPGHSVIVHVADDGPGIGNDELPHIFERFYRSQRGRQARSGGTGLGLAICKAFVEAHGGEQRQRHDHLLFGRRPGDGVQRIHGSGNGGRVSHGPSAGSVVEGEADD